MVIRGAPQIGVAAAMGAALGVLHFSAKSVDALKAELAEICTTLEATRPTAVVLSWALERMCNCCVEITSKTYVLAKIKRTMLAEAHQTHNEKRATAETLARFGPR